ILFGQFKSDVAALQLFGHGERRSAASERIEHDFVFIRAGTNDATEQLFGHLATMPAAPLVERSGDAREIPQVAVGRETIGNVLRAKYKSIPCRDMLRQNRR